MSEGTFTPAPGGVMVDDKVLVTARSFENDNRVGYGKPVSQWSESLLGLPLPPEDSCPGIDEGVSEVRRIESWAQSIVSTAQDAEPDGSGDDAAAIRAALESIESEASDIDSSTGAVRDALEYARKQCEAIRTWGQAWKDQAKEFLQEINDLQDQLKGAREEHAQCLAVREKFKNVLKDLKPGDVYILGEPKFVGKILYEPLPATIPMDLLTEGKTPEELATTAAEETKDQLKTELKNRPASAPYSPGV